MGILLNKYMLFNVYTLDERINNRLMKTPKRIQPLIADGIVDEVLQQLMSGKEATVYAVRRGDDVICAKVYKEATKRSFKQATQYQEGRKVRNTRRARAMEKGSKFGRKQQEDSWHNAEVEALYKVANAGVRVPEPYGCFDGVLLMELITDSEGDVASRLSEFEFTEEQAVEYHGALMNDVMKMLVTGIIHGDLSEFNILIDCYGPVIIDLPQAVDAAANNHAKSMLIRDVRNVTAYFAQFAPQLENTQYAKEMWDLYENAKLTLDTKLTGIFIESEEDADVDGVMREIESAIREEEMRKIREQEAEDML
jgi:RIO kinase 1